MNWHWLFCKWTKWSEPYQVASMFYWKGQTTGIPKFDTKQKRTCTICNAVDVRDAEDSIQTTPTREAE